MGAVIDVLHPLIPYMTGYQLTVPALQRHREAAGLAIVKRAHGYKAGGRPFLGTRGVDPVASLGHPHGDSGRAHADDFVRLLPRRVGAQTIYRLLEPAIAAAVCWGWRCRSSLKRQHRAAGDESKNR